MSWTLPILLETVGSPPQRYGHVRALWHRPVADLENAVSRSSNQQLCSTASQSILLLEKHGHALMQLEMARGQSSNPTCEDRLALCFVYSKPASTNEQRTFHTMCFYARQPPGAEADG